MNKKNFGVAIVFLMTLLLAACFTDVIDPQEIADIVSKTQTAMAQLAAQNNALPPKTQPPPPPPLDTQPPLPPDRCSHFDPEQNSFALHSIKWGDTSFVMYVKLPEGEDVPGLAKTVEGDLEPWIYSGDIGGLESIECGIYEGELYKGRIYCLYPIDKTYYNTSQPFEFKVNGCDMPVASHPYLSLIVPEPEGKSSGSGPTGCGSEPQKVCGAIYEAWCTCRGLLYTCTSEAGFDVPGCPVPKP